MLEDLEVPRFCQRAFEAEAARLEEAVEAHHAEADAAFAHRAIFRPRHFFRRAVDIVLQDIVEEAHHVLDKVLVDRPFVPGFEIERGQAADGGAVFAEMIAAGGQRDLGTESGGRYLQAQIAVMLGHHPVHRVAEDNIGLASGQPCLDQFLEQTARIDRAADRAVLR